ncbi:DUF1573 domain-containing protein [Ekhidna sp. To15]|uniref:DUF1573 domain-containing protein n=1 Tax=Ekhidna sp. To15 TaxID=3395267 RepID=UPI003F5238BC
MRKATFIVMLGIAVAVVAGMAPIKWKTTSIDLGQVTKSESKDLSFEFTNMTNEPIRILEAKGSCGCTNVKFPSNEIGAGETASITANFRSGKIGSFKKNIRIKTSESEEYTYLYFNGEVVE